MANLAAIPLTPEEIVGFLKQEVHFKEISQKILYQKIIARSAEERNVVVTPEEIQQEADQRRYQLHLESAAATFEWLGDQLITAEDWEAGIYRHLLTQKLAEHLFGSEIEKYFVEHRLEFEQVLLYRITVPYHPIAQELFYQIEEREIGFYEAAHLYNLDEQHRLQCGYEGKLYRWSLKPEIAAVLFGARAGEVIGPLQSDQGYDLFLAEEFIAAELTPETRQTILDRMFEEWLDSELNYWIHNARFPTSGDHHHDSD